ncbi:cupin domain-containing protein [Gordonia sp. ABSL11-1]|uniref:cupin domain-containing protein n=1 Tax=Gordonia sp. ABSL11-1 TaxID=3053924 RepID=UPI0025724CA1|nr:cupin domain-containing protein [Gordonia sp. ABSL11-1]MDL9948658.1 cupin domain-containing protein [Gordonia sp. ABSL11-1]
MTIPPFVIDVDDLVGYKISPDDTVTLALLSGPATSGSETTVCLEIWDPLGTQPPNSHPESSETFVVLRGEGVGHSDEHTRLLSSGTVIVMAAGSVHQIVNTSPTHKMYAITVMERDRGFEEMILSGTQVPLSNEDRKVVVAAAKGPVV